MPRLWLYTEFNLHGAPVLPTAHLGMAALATCGNPGDGVSRGMDCVSAARGHHLPHRGNFGWSTVCNSGKNGWLGGLRCWKHLPC
jgi:hypothetical protein